MPTKSEKKPSSKATTAKRSVAKKTPAKENLAKKSLAEKTDTTPVKEVFSSVILIKLWLEGWKKAFNAEGRASRFELWIFLIVNSVLGACVHLQCNYILSPKFLRVANAEGYSLNQIENCISIAQIVLYAVFLFSFIAIISLLIRRLHDLGKQAWKGYAEPLCYGFMTIAGLNIVTGALEITGDYPYSILLLNACYAITLYSIGYYILKLLITAFFYRGEENANIYGKALYNTDEHERIALKLSCFYFLFVTTIFLLYSAVFILQD